MAELRFIQDGTKYAFDPDTIRTVEAIELKKMTGYTVVQWSEALGEMDAEAFRALVWLARKRAGDTPEGRYSDFDFPLIEVAQSFEVDEEPEADPTPAAT